MARSARGRRGVPAVTEGKQMYDNKDVKFPKMTGKQVLRTDGKYKHTKRLKQRQRESKK